jgi:cbb3-type cytochrome oxidase maturation protein
MGIIFLFVLFSAIIAIVFLAAFIFSVKFGQFDDTDTPAKRILLADYEVKYLQKKE